MFMCSFTVGSWCTLLIWTQEVFHLYFRWTEVLRRLNVSLGSHAPAFAFLVIASVSTEVLSGWFPGNILSRNPRVYPWATCIAEQFQKTHTTNGLLTGKNGVRLAHVVLKKLTKLHMATTNRLAKWQHWNLTNDVRHFPCEDEQTRLEKSQPQI